MTAAEQAQADAKRYAVRFTTDAPKRQVRPKLPNSFDAAQRDTRGVPTVSDAQYRTNNRDMYSLTDVPATGTPVDRGWQSPTNPMAIAERYGGRDAMVQTGANMVSATPQGGSAGPSGPAGSTAARSFDNVAAIRSQTAQGGANAGVQPPAQNAQQRWAGKKADWMEAGGSNRTWNNAGVALGIRPRIDARTTPSPRNSSPNPVSFPNSQVNSGAPVTFGKDSTMTPYSPSDMQLPY